MGAWQLVRGVSGMYAKSSEFEHSSPRVSRPEVARYACAPHCKRCKDRLCDLDVKGDFYTCTVLPRLEGQGTYYNIWYYVPLYSVVRE